MKDLELTITVENNMANLDYNDIIDRMEEACADIEAALTERGYTIIEKMVTNNWVAFLAK